MSESPDRGPKKKIVRVIHQYELEGIGAKMAKLWVKENESERYSLQELIDLFNRRMLQAAMENGGMNPAPGEVENTYSYLIDDDISYSEHEETRMRLKNRGVKIEKVIEDFVRSRQTMATYLRDVQNVDYSPEQTRSEEKNQRQIIYLRKFERRYETVAEGIIEDLKADSELPPDEFDIDIECVVINKSSGKSKEIKNLIKQINMV